MATSLVRKSPWFTVLLVLAALVLWVIDLQHDAAGKTAKPPTHAEKQIPPAKPEKKSPTTKKAEKQGAYEVYHDCVLVDVRGNDGDSFTVRLPDGRKVLLRLYFVDTPESEFRRYAGGETNHERIRQQAAEMGGITSEQAVEIGKKGKKFTLDLLAARPFTIHTCWDSPFHDDRFHAFIEVRPDGKARWLHQLLVERGLARIKTKPANLPDGTSASRERDHLREIERDAKRREIGVWGLD